MKAYKGFNPDLTCDPTGAKPFQFREGETYEESSAAVCKRGFHACTLPLDVLGYYGPASSVYHVVEVDDDAQTHPDDSKVASRKITIGAQIGIPGLVKAQFEAIWDRCKVERGGHAEKDRGAASATGGRGAASATGYYGAASATGGRGAASATGGRGAASATGYYGAASATGPDSVALAAGYHGRAKGALGCALMLVERDQQWHIIAAKAVIVDGRRIKPDTWYGLHGGKVVRVDDDGDPIVTKAVAK